MAFDDGGPAFPLPVTQFNPGSPGMSLLDFFASTDSAQPTEEAIKLEFNLDKSRNPYNDPHKPPIRGRLEVITDLRYEYAKAMLEARKRTIHVNKRN